MPLGVSHPQIDIMVFRMCSKGFNSGDSHWPLKGTRVNSSHVISVSNNTLLRPNISDSYLEKSQDECVLFLGSHISNANSVRSVWSCNLTLFIGCLEVFGSLDVYT